MKNAKEKQIPKKPIGITDEGTHHKCYCPTCEEALSLEYLPPFCPSCKQALARG